jgi:hypothetical protein
MGYRMMPPEASCKRAHVPSRTSQAIEAPPFSDDDTRGWQPSRGLAGHKKTTASNLYTRFGHLLTVTQTCHVDARKGECARRSPRGTVDAPSGEREHDNDRVSQPGCADSGFAQTFVPIRTNVQGSTERSRPNSGRLIYTLRSAAANLQASDLRMKIAIDGMRSRSMCER